MQQAMTTNCYQPTDAENSKYEDSVHPHAATMTELLHQLQFQVWCKYGCRNNQLIYAFDKTLNKMHY